MNSLNKLVDRLKIQYEYNRLLEKKAPFKQQHSCNLGFSFCWSLLLAFRKVMNQSLAFARPLRLRSIGLDTGARWLEGWIHIVVGMGMDSPLRI